MSAKKSSEFPGIFFAYKYCFSPLILIISVKFA
jgi:hypothetical protein